MPEEPPKPKRRHTGRPKRLPPSPEQTAAVWQPPGRRPDTPPLPVPHAVRKDKRQIPLPLDLLPGARRHDR